ncbi:MAG TPA: SpoIIE family protein phosphatase [Acidobacteriaceae bacterium]|nr:SpoIIE family protein phosphatase [Acidobacteriaceae bacterium]
MLLRAKKSALVFLLAASVFAQQQTPKPSSPLIVQGLGRGSVQLGGPWQFHLGDEPLWASPSFDDSKWQTISTSSSWGSQSHPGYTGFAWYRRHLDLENVADANLTYALLIPPVDDAYEVYWNGKLIGRYGHLPPHPRWYYSSFYCIYGLPSVGPGVIAIRVWKAPLLFVDSASLGGINATPVLGDSNTLSAQLAAINADSTRQELYDYTLAILYGVVMLASLILWSRERKVKLFLWLAIFTATPIFLSLLQGLFLLPIPYGWARGLNQPIYALNHVSLWFLLIWLLRLNDNRILVHWTRDLAICTLAAGILDGALAFFWGHAGFWMQTADAVLTTIIFLVEILPFIIVAVAVRQRLEPWRWLVALSALASQMIDTIADASAAGQSSTHWTVFETINTPLFSMYGVTFRAANVAAIILFLAILYAVYRYTTEQQARQTALEREMQSAREIQQVLIPETLPSLEGFAVTSAYQPALEVGGDFFQIIGEANGSTIVALGDVSGKGLKAAMNVSLIVGVLRSMADAGFSPRQMLERLNRCLCGRLQGGFVTAVILRLHPNGDVTLANAGHLPPFLNRQELEIGGCLPLGLLPSVTYDEVNLSLHPGDYLSLYTDGLLEARNATGELYGFERVQKLLAARPSAHEATNAAIAFGQEDDITVLTLIRLAAGQESTTSLKTPFMAPDPVEL